LSGWRLSWKFDAVLEYKQSIISEPYWPAFARSDLKGPGLVSYFDVFQDVEPVRSYFKDEEVLRGQPPLSFEKQQMRFIPVECEVETVSTETISKSF